MTEPADNITRILASMDPASSAELLPLVYDQLRKLAKTHMQRERGSHTLQATALVHEAFLRLGCSADTEWSGRRHFFCAAAEAMRRILIDQARRKRMTKHGGGLQQVQLDEQDLPIEVPASDLVAVDQALEELESADPRARQIVNLRYFVGMTVEETAAALGISPSTVEREWRFLRTFLQKRLLGPRTP